MDAWMHGTVGITDEVIVRWPRDQVQHHALQVAGEPLPDEAFGICAPPPPIVQAIDGARLMGMIAP